MARHLVRWAADARVDEAGRARARARWLRRQAEEEATFAGVVVDLAEREAVVLVRTTSGRRHRGVVAVVGADFLLLRAEPPRWLLLPFGAVTTVRGIDEAGRPAAGRREPTVDLLLGEALDAMASDRTRVAVVAAGDPDPVSGELEAVGDDVLTVRLDAQTPNRAYVRIALVTEIGVGA